MRRLLIFLLIIAAFLHVNPASAVNNQEIPQHNQEDNIESTENDDINNDLIKPNESGKHRLLRFWNWTPRELF